MNLKPMTPEQLFDSLIVATAAHKAGATTRPAPRRWLRQFDIAFANDEGEESSSFQGTIPQALMMMNGELMEKAVGGRSGSFLADLFEQAQLQSRGLARRLCREAPLPGRTEPVPDRRELQAARKFLNNYEDTVCVMEDMFWALLNSNEFVLNR